MEQALANLFTNSSVRQELISKINSDTELFRRCLKIACSEESYAWRAAWILRHSIRNNDSRIIPVIPDLVGAIESKEDGHQRELLKILRKMHLSEDQEGYLFDICMDIWESIGKSPSVRIMAFKILMKIVEKYPELKSELKFLVGDRYSETLSKGVKKVFMKIKNQMDL